MKRATSIAILGVLVVGTVAIGAGARARQRISAEGTSDRFTPRSELHATAGSPGESRVAPPSLSVEVNQSLSPRAAPQESIDWGNPYDLMLHGIEPGRTRDMR